ncbi:NAD(P)-dependent oxidoreductase [Polynucleobacter paneuropaeus]|nr:NAD(P)-dependent oxidoreductase [Polynucleobacter paneuropaeus]
MKILITGGTGFVGKPVLSLLEKSDHDVLVLTRKSHSDVRQNNRVNFIVANLADPQSYKEHVANFEPEVIVHLAWDGIPDYSTEVSLNNLKNSIELISFCLRIKSCKKIIVSGSCFEIPNPAGEIIENNQFGVKDSFTWAKYSLYLWLKQACEKAEIDFLWLRLFYVYGPGQRMGSIIPAILNSLKLNGDLPNIKTPQNQNDFVYVDDVATMINAAIQKKVPSGIFNVGSGYATSVIDICKISEMLVMGADKLSINIAEGQGLNPGNASVNFWANIDKSSTAFEWAPATKISEGILRVLESMHD